MAKKPVPTHCATITILEFGGKRSESVVGFLRDYRGNKAFTVIKEDGAMGSTFYVERPFFEGKMVATTSLTSRLEVESLLPLDPEAKRKHLEEIEVEREKAMAREKDLENLQKPYVERRKALQALLVAAGYGERWDFRVVNKCSVTARPKASSSSADMVLFSLADGSFLKKDAVDIKGFGIQGSYVTNKNVFKQIQDAQQMIELALKFLESNKPPEAS